MLTTSGLQIADFGKRRAGLNQSKWAASKMSGAMKWYHESGKTYPFHGRYTIPSYIIPSLFVSIP